VTCPWHGSTFRVSDGAVIHGPATARQPAFESRITESGWVQVRPRATRERERAAPLAGGNG
jgi:nitrite reductase/ring-hydroxylating ferredoxin subunit